MVPDWYKSQMVNLVSKGKVRIELMVTGGQECYCYTWNFNLGWSVYSNQYSREGTQSAVLLGLTQLKFYGRKYSITYSWI